ncbi:MAG TPA: DNA polymerase Y family protein [Dokdonella sp.]|nr:DNA polymerase Y family protein [Dokdonella sp.]
MFWVCLHYPRLALEALHSGVPADRPQAVVDGPQQRRHVVLANAAAGKTGVRAQQPLASAQLLCPGLVVAPRDEAAERQALASLADHAYRYSADISIAGPDALFLEVGASLKLFGGWPALERRMRADVERLGHACTLAAAPTATAARVFAACRPAIALPTPAQLALALDAAPLVASGLDPKIVAALHGMGMRTLGDLFRLPRAELARRIGQPALAHLDRMRGLVAETLPRWQPPQRYARRMEFGYGIESHTALAFPLQRLVREFAQFLVARDGGVQRFAIELGHERDAHTRIDIGLLAPQRDAASLLELARARLERVELVAPVHALALRADDLPPLCPLHRDLFETNRREQLDWPALVERLRARLGDAALQGLACVADHRPDRAWRFVPLSMQCHAPAATPTARPFWLLRRPLPLRGRPVRVLAGPERIESGWWDEGDQRRDYYIIETCSGQRAWAFVDAGRTPDRDAPWTLQGWFA